MMFAENPEEGVHFDSKKLDERQGLQFRPKDEEMSDEMMSSDDEDNVAEMNEEQFQQANYLFLFDDELGISKLSPNGAAELTPGQYQQMKEINRRKLCEFFDFISGNKGVMQDIVVEVSHINGPGEDSEIVKKVITFSDQCSSHSGNSDLRVLKKSPRQRFPKKLRRSFVHEMAEITDEEIDANFKLLLEKKSNGQYFSPEIVAHFEYFMNTLNMNHKNNTENPFTCPAKYPALLYNGITVQNSHTNSDAVMESVQSEGSNEEDDFYDDVQEKKINVANAVGPGSNIFSPGGVDDLIDTSQIQQDMKDQEKKRIQEQQYPIKTPKILGLGKKQTSALSLRLQRKASVRQEIRRQSNMYVQNLNIFERNRLLIKPNTHLKKVRNTVRQDKQSILSSRIGSQVDTRSISGKICATLIDHEDIQRKIIKKSIKMMRPRGSWYPNQDLKGNLCARFTGSPMPKVTSNGKLTNRSAIKSPFKGQTTRMKNFELNPFIMNGDFTDFSTHQMPQMPQMPHFGPQKLPMNANFGFRQ